ncbi:MAG: heme ABC exporter ATP-binding protein CcmA [Anaerolineae bacterium]|nr:heme ABC exporter ATP-binding protein CcmA [Anaerolineae bacterium]
MIKTSKLIKVFGLRPVLRGVDLAIGPGEFLALFGPNGAGKTTLLRILATLARPTGGSVVVAGRALPAEAAVVRGLIGMVAHRPLVYGDLTAEENLRFYSRMYGLDGAEREARIKEMLAMVGLSKRAGDLVRTFSRGMQQRLSIARAVLHDPPVLLLDEPYTGLDQAAAAALDDILREVAGRGRTILMATHDIERGLALAGRAAILSKGVIAYQSRTAETTPQAFAETYQLLIAD